MKRPTPKSAAAALLAITLGLTLTGCANDLVLSGPKDASQTERQAFVGGMEKYNSDVEDDFDDQLDDLEDDPDSSFLLGELPSNWPSELSVPTSCEVTSSMATTLNTIALLECEGDESDVALVFADTWEGNGVEIDRTLIEIEMFSATLTNGTEVTFMATTSTEVPSSTDVMITLDGTNSGGGPTT